MNRRTFLAGGIGALTAAGALATPRGPRSRPDEPLQEFSRDRLPVRSIIPVVADGKWVWIDPPEDETGYLEPRRFDVAIGIELTGKGDASGLIATTVAPVQFPEQKIIDVKIDTQGCAAELRAITREAGQLYLAAPSIVRGQVVGAIARYQLEVYKDYRDFKPESFPAEQEYPRDFRLAYTGVSPGIQTAHASVKRLARDVGGQFKHPWDRAHAFFMWVRENIEPRVQYFTSVVRAVRDRIGDCEECAAVFVALCRASGIPARLVWVPGHNWAEFGLHDDNGQLHWIPAHTSCYHFFGWTGVHEVVLQKGDKLFVPEKRQPQRLLADWLQWRGRKPELRYLAEVTPVPDAEDEDPGPGARVKDEIGKWETVGRHASAEFTRQT